MNTDHKHVSPDFLAKPQLLPLKKRPAYGNTLRQAWTLGVDDKGQLCVSVHAKRTYRIAANGRCRLAEQQIPLIIEPLRDESGEIVFAEGDILPAQKTTTDLIVLAAAHGGGARQSEVAIEVGGSRWSCLVFGDRTCHYTSAGRIVFSDPAPFDTIPLRYEHAYGGIDARYENHQAETLEEAFSPHPGVYPRNAVGKGYVVCADKQGVEGLSLPNLEFPLQLLTPETLAPGRPEDWWHQPLSWSCDWFDKLWYPRMSYFGSLPYRLPADDAQLPEVLAKWVMVGQRQRAESEDPEAAIDLKLFDAASPALVLPTMHGTETVLLEGMSATGSLPVVLADERPKMHIRYRGRAHEVDTLAPHRVLVSLDEMGVSLVWHGRWVVPSDFPLKMPEPEQPIDELVPIEVFVDGEKTVGAA